MLFDDVLEEYLYHCQAKGITAKTLKNKRQAYKQLRIYLIEKRGISELESISDHDLKSYVRLKQRDGVQPQSIVSMFKMIKAFFSWCEKEENLKDYIATKVELPKVPIKIFEWIYNKRSSSND